MRPSSDTFGRVGDIHIFSGQSGRGVPFAARCPVPPRPHPSAQWEDPSVEQRRHASTGMRCKGWPARTPEQNRDQGPEHSLGHPVFVAAHLKRTSTKVLEDRTSHVPDVQSAWLLLFHCASARANHLLRVVNPEQVQGFAGESRHQIVGVFVRHLGIPCDGRDRLWPIPFWPS